MRRVVFGIFAARITVVVFNQVFKNRGEKSNFAQNRLEAETRQLGNQRAAKIVAATFVSNVLTNTLKQHDFRPAFGFHRKQLSIMCSDVSERIVKVWQSLRRFAAPTNT